MGNRGIYDNWGRLVEAVQRRERDYELAMCHSRDISVISDDGSSSSTRFSFDTPTTPLFRDSIPETNWTGLGVDYDLAPPVDPIITACLMDEFRKVSFRHVDLTYYSGEVDLASSDMVYYLRCIAERVIAEGYLREYVHVYVRMRKSFVDASLKKLNVVQLSIGDIERLGWETLEQKIEYWLMAVKTCVRVLFASERKLCKQIFEGLGNSASTGDHCFIETIRLSAIQLFSFPHAISIITQSTEKVFKILDLRESLSNLLPDIESVFDSESGDPIRIWVVNILSRLSKAVREIILALENSVLGDPCIRTVPRGIIHPITRYVMNYLVRISYYKLTLLELIVSKPSTVLSTYTGDPITFPTEFEGDGSALALHLIWIITLLQLNLSWKSNLYKDDSLAHFFMMNNIHYILQKINMSPDLRELIGDDYWRSLIEKLGSASINYQEATWLRPLRCLRDEGIHVSEDFSSGVSKSVLKERFKSFNAMFEEVRRTQAMWLIPDTHLREELRISLKEMIIPAYKMLCVRFIRYSGKNPEKYIKYSVEDLEKSLFEDFFEGCPVSRHLGIRSKRDELKSVLLLRRRV